MSKKKVLGLVSAVVMAATLVAGVMGHGPLAAEIKAAVCGGAVAQ